MSTNGMVLWEGKSPIDGSPLVLIATGINRSSKNMKTGSLIQTWIIRSDMSPSESVRTGQDIAQCGSCSKRPFIAGGAVKCYVRVYQAPQNIYKCYKKGLYEKADFDMIGKLPLRAGSYGDPAMVPVEIWEKLNIITGYTHQWKEKWAQPYKKFFMASCDGPGDHAEARSLGWRSFVTIPYGSSYSGLNSTIECVNSSHNVSCADCGLCSGLKRPLAKDIYIHIHGVSKHNHEKGMFSPQLKSNLLRILEN